MKSFSGQKGEKWACEFLEYRGYTILDCNWRWRKKEIDIIASGPDGVLLFVEVKSRSYFFQQGPAGAVTPKKQKNILSAAHQYIIQKKLNPPRIRFDIIALIDTGRTREIKHIENAFYPI